MFWLVLLFARNPSPTSSDDSVTTILCDVALDLLPAFLVWKLQLNSCTKFAVRGILGLRAMYVLYFGQLATLEMNLLLTINNANSAYQIAIGSNIEAGLGITAGSLVTLRPLFRWLLDKISTHNHKSSHQGNISNSSQEALNP
ncbi:hypothetical protein N7471_005463 [Penicillium samsonianum]|uniref:uncharacterized protein n=1 Tax=Penicillium samsonianum TaxID=1882272 RepID=UPI00254809D8|nr:uncharacterized protein N7471_005463 [Penicillium samsonianum]KAJ6138977.1 hypothetical protein N7471_005463 [Penicillium samsonianum]